MLHSKKTLCKPPYSSIGRLLCKSKYLLLCWIFFLTCLMKGCHDNSADVVPDKQLQKDISAENAHLTFSELTNEIFLKEVTSDSITLHYTIASPQALSIPNITPTLGHIGEQTRLDSIEQVEGYLTELEKISYDTLSSKDQITYDILKWQFESIVSSRDFNYFSEDISPTIGIQAQLPILLAEYEFRCSKDIEDYILLLRQLPQYYTELLTYQQEKAAAGLFMANATVDDVVQQCNDFLCDVNNHYLTSTFNQRIDTLEWLSEQQKSQFKALNLSTLTEYVYPAYTSLTEGLTALKDTCTNQEGLCHYPDGKAYYAFLVKMSTGSESTPDELIKRTQKQLQSDLNSMALIMEENPSVLENISSPAVTFTDPEAILDHLKEAMTEDFPTGPNVACTVKYVDPSLEKHLSPAFYLTPPVDRITQNVIYINKPSFRDNVQLFTTLAHEGYPGHLYQNISSQSASPDKVRSLFSFPGYAEGYATYAEMFSYDYMGLDGDVSSLLKLSSSVTLGIYAAVDLGIHHEGWSLEDTKAFLTKYGITDAATITEIYHAIVAEPANYLKYYIGYLEFLTLREKAEEVWGNEFTDKKFHQYILNMGDAPFVVLNKWLK